MPKVMKAVTVERPVHEVFAYVDEPAHLPEIWPSLFEVEDVEPAPVRRFGWRYNLAGTLLAGRTETIERVNDEKLVEQASGEIESTFTWKFQVRNGFTKLVFEADYRLPEAIEPRLERFLITRNEREADLMLENLKARLEV